MSWFEKLLPSRIRTDGKKSRHTVPEGLWSKCPMCQAVLYHSELERNCNVCPKCNHHMRIPARQRLNGFFDGGSSQEIGENLLPVDKLKFRDSKRYRDRISAAQKSTSEKDALVAMQGRVYDFPVVAVAFEFDFMGGSMGGVLGEKFVRAVNVALEQRLPFICFSSSGGARMQEALFSLMQMGKTSAALKRLNEQQLPFISVLTDPTMGGVSASLAMLGDINIAEPNALIGFAGPRVIEQTVRETLPSGFQRSEFLLEHGAIDLIVDRREMRERLIALLAMLMNQPSPLVAMLPTPYNPPETGCHADSTDEDACAQDDPAGVTITGQAGTESTSAERSSEAK